MSSFPYLKKTIQKSNFPSTHGAVSSYAYLGAHNLYSEEDGRLIIFTQKFYEHPDYDVENIANDVSMVQLPKGSVASYTTHIRPACLPAR